MIRITQVFLGGFSPLSYRKGKHNREEAKRKEEERRDLTQRKGKGENFIISVSDLPVYSSTTFSFCQLTTITIHNSPLSLLAQDLPL